MFPASASSVQGNPSSQPKIEAYPANVALDRGCLAVFFLSRFPAIACPFELDRDESQMAAQAMRYGKDLTPWRSVEGETNGPLDSWFLLAAHQAGMPYAYRALHLTAALALAALLLAGYAAARRLVDNAAACAALAAGAWWLALAPVESLVHYASEIVPALLIGFGAAALARSRRTAGLGAAFAGGVLLGLAPWAKLQSGPIALAVGLWALVDCLTDRPGAPGVRKRRAYALVLGAAAPSLWLLGWVAAAGAGEEFWQAYVRGGLYHGHARPWAEHAANLAGLALWHPASPWLWGFALLAAAALALGRRAAWSVVPRRSAALAAAWLGAALFCVLRPVTQWPHYMLLALGPLMLAVALAARGLLGPPGRFSPMRRRLGWAVLALCLLPPPVYKFLRLHYLTAAAAMAYYQESHAFDGQVYLAQAVQHAAPGLRSMAVWGWKPSLYVDLGVAPATRSAVCAFLTDDGNPSRDLLRAAYLADLKTAPPDVIVDVEDYVYRGRRQSDPASFPALAAYLRERYALAGNFEGRRSADYSLVVAVYARK